MENKKRKELEDSIISDEKLVEFEESIIKEFKKKGIDYNLETLKALKEGLTVSGLVYVDKKIPFEIAIGLAIAGTGKLIRRKEEFQKQMEAGSKKLKGQ